MVYASIWADGRITIPKEIRVKLGIKGKSFLQVEVCGNAIVLKPIKEAEQSDVKQKQ